MFGYKKRGRSSRNTQVVSEEREKGPPIVQGHKKFAMNRAKDNPANYEGKEHVKYKDPGYSSHEINFPDDEPHMKSHVSRNEEHEMEDNFHMDVPDQTEDTLPSKLKRAHMLMDSPEQEDPKPLRGNLVNDVGFEGEEDTSGEEEMGPNKMQSKEGRKKMIVAVMKRKMKKSRMDDSEGEDEIRDKKKLSRLRSS